MIVAMGAPVSSPAGCLLFSAELRFQHRRERPDSTFSHRRLLKTHGHGHDGFDNQEEDEMEPPRRFGVGRNSV